MSPPPPLRGGAMQRVARPACRPNTASSPPKDLAVQVDVVGRQEDREVEGGKDRLRQEHGEERDLLEAHVPTDCARGVGGGTRGHARRTGGRAGDVSNSPELANPAAACAVGIPRCPQRARKGSGVGILIRYNSPRSSLLYTSSTPPLYLLYTSSTPQTSKQKASYLVTVAHARRGKACKLGSGRTAGWRAATRGLRPPGW